MENSVSKFELQRGNWEWRFQIFGCKSRNLTSKFQIFGVRGLNSESRIRKLGREAEILNRDFEIWGVNEQFGVKT